MTARLSLGFFGGAVNIISSGVCLAKGALGNRDLSFRSGDCTSSAISAVIAPDLRAVVSRVCSVRT